RLQQKLRAIAKHTEALANELDEIDKDRCSVCGGAIHRTIYYVDGIEANSVTVCPKCEDDKG
ncbi:hypothetical protein, partial [Bacillus sp. mrc49]